MDANKDQTSILGNAKPSQAIVKLALPTTLALLPRQSTTSWTPPILGCWALILL